MTPNETEKSRFRRFSDGISCRFVLNLMVIIGFMFNYMLRVNLTIAIVEMVLPPNTTAVENGNATIENGNIENGNYEMNTTDSNTEIVDHSTRYPWDKYEQNMLLGSFFVGYVLTELPGGRLAEIIGARRVFGYSMGAASFVTLLTPIAAECGFMFVLVLRVLLGFFLGATWPAMPPMANKWIPPNDRSKFIANMMASSLGAALTMPVCGFLIHHFGWPSTFYCTGLVGVVWTVAWFFLIYDSPSSHPRISEEERNFIEQAIEDATGRQSKKPSKVPWGQLLTSLPVWAIVLCHGCSVFSYFTVVNQLPTFIKEVHQVNIKKNGVLSSLPYLGKYVMAVIASWLADYLRRNGKLTTTQTRKAFTAFAVLGPAVMMVFQAIYGNSAIFSSVILTASMLFNGAVTAGYLANALDIAPNFSGTIFGMANTLSSIGGFVSTYMVAAITNKDQSFEAWRWVFWILVGIYLFGGITYIIFGTGELQPWNSVKITEEEGPEAVPLSEKDEKVKQNGDTENNVS